MREKKLKLMIVINDFLVGGAQRLNVEILRRIDREKFDITLVTLMNFPGRDTMYDLIPHDIIVKKLEFKDFFDFRNWIGFAKYIRISQPDVVLSHLFFANTVVRILNIFNRYKTITVEHNTYIGNKKWQIWSDRLLSRYSKKVVAVSEEVKIYASRQQHLLDNNVVVIKNGLDIDLIKEKALGSDRKKLCHEIGIDENSKIAIMVGRLTKQKEPLLLIEGFARFSKKHSDYHLVILGDGSLKSAMEKRAEELGVAENVHFQGSVSDLERYYGSAEFLVSASLIEGLSMAQLEALACGVPLLSTHTAGSKELIKNGKNGMFIDNHDSESIERGFEKMIQADLINMRKEAFETAKNYDIQSTVGQYEKLILNI